MNPEVSQREGYIGGSDAAVILGVSPWRTRMQLCAEKRGVASFESEPNTDALFFFGNLMEEPIGRAVEHYYGLKIKRHVGADGKQKFVRSKKHSFMGGHIDFLEDAAKPSFFLECKNVRFASKDWSPMRDEPLEDEASGCIPAYYLAQCRHYMALLEVQYCYLAALFGGSELRLYRINRDDDAERVLIVAEQDFWDRYVIGDDLPEPKVAEDFQLALGITHRMPAKREIVLTPEQITSMERLAKVRRRAKNLTDEAGDIRDEMIVLAAGGNATFIDDEGNLIGSVVAAVRQSPDIARFKRECPKEYAKYAQYIKTSGYFTVRTASKAEDDHDAAED